MTDACTNAPTHSRKPCCKRLSGQKETDQTSTHCINVWSNYGAGGGTRTRTPSLVMDFESTSSTNSNTPARCGKVYTIFREISSTNYAASSPVSSGINIRFISVGSAMPGTCSVKLYCHMSTA